jgi:hypothetical protein
MNIEINTINNIFIQLFLYITLCGGDGGGDAEDNVTGKKSEAVCFFLLLSVDQINIMRHCSSVLSC